MSLPGATTLGLERTGGRLSRKGQAGVGKAEHLFFARLGIEMRTSPTALLGERNLVRPDV